MSLKEEWKKSGTEVGHAFKKFGKTFVRSARTCVDEVDDRVNDEDAPTPEAETSKAEGAETPEGAQPEGKEGESNVFNDGSWRETGKGIGRAFLGLGKTLVGTVKAGVSDEPGTSPSAEPSSPENEEAKK